jgi:hypothetical protein
MGPFCSRYPKIFAQAYNRCFGGVEDRIAPLATTADGWHAYYPMTTFCELAADAVGDGTWAYDESKVAGCFAAIGNAPCETLLWPWGASRNRGAPTHDEDLSPWRAGGPCDLVFTGQVPRDGHCYRSDDCTEADFCQKAEGACAGTCRPRALPGAPCAQWDGCTEGRVCRPGQTGGTSYCQRPFVPAVGHPCDGVLNRCRVGAWCDMAGGDQGVCRSQQTSGTCSSPFACSHGYYCDGWRHPDVSGTCKPAKAEGQSCAGWDESECRLGTGCGHSKICQAWNRAGGSCGPTLRCLDSWCGGDRTCKSFLNENAPCEETRPEACGPSAWCVEGRCQRHCMFEPLP